MGVIGLWGLLHPLARPITLESLEGQTLAVDTSVWLHQALKSGNEVPNAHLVVLFHRICKLILFRIKPVFVFDGKPPALKLDTLGKRRQQRLKAHESAEKLREQLLQNYIKKKAVSSVYKKGSAETKEDDSSLFKINDALRPDIDSTFVQEDAEDGWIETASSALDFADADLEDIDIAGEDFMSLPLEIQHEVLVEMLERFRKSRFAPSDVSALAKSCVDFSELQFSRLKRRGEINHRLDAVRRAMAHRDTADSVADILKGQAVEEILSRRIVSQDEGHTVLLKARERSAASAELSRNEGNNAFSRPTTSSVKDEIRELNVISSQKATHDDQNVSEEWLDHSVEGDQEICTIDWTSVEAMRAKLRIKQAAEDTSREDIIVKEKKLNPKAENSMEINESVKDADGEIDVTEVRDDVLKENLSQEVMNVDEGGVIRQSEELRNIIALDADSSKDETLVSDGHGDVTGSSQTLSQELSFKTEDLNEKVKRELQVVHDISDSSNGSDDDFIDVEDVQIEDQSVIIEEDKSQGDTQRLKEEPETNDVDRVVEQETDSTGSTSGVGFSAEEIYQIGENPQNWLEQMESEEVILRHEKSRSEAASSGMHEEIYREAQDLLRIFGIPWLLSPGEAEAQCAVLERLGLVDGSITEDSDIWVFGGKRVVKNLFKQNLTPEEYRYEHFENALGLHRDRLINLAMLCGSDYTTGIDGIGPVGALEILSEFQGGGMEPLLNFRNWWMEAKAQPNKAKAHPIRKKLARLDLPSDFPNEVVRRAYLQPNVDESNQTFSWSTPDLDLLREFVKEKLGWSQQKVDNFMMPVLRRMREKQHQMKLTAFDFVVSSNSSGPTSPSKSKRLQRALNRLRDGETPDSEMRESKEKKNQTTKRKQKPRKDTDEKYCRVAKGSDTAKSRRGNTRKNTGRGRKYGKFSTDRKVVERVNLSEESEEEIASDVDVDDFIRNVNTDDL